MQTRAHARDYLVHKRGSRFQAPGTARRCTLLWVVVVKQSAVNSNNSGNGNGSSQGGQGQEFLGVRECLAHIATSYTPEIRERSLEAVRQDPQGRSG